MNCLTLNPDILRTHPLFSSFTDTQLAWITPSVKHRSYPAGAYILHAGDAPDGLYIVLSGHARIVHEDNHGHALIAADVGPNEFLGEMGLIDATPCPASIQAVDRCELAFIPRKAFLECIYENASAAVYVLRRALERLCATHEKMANIALMNVHARVARVMLENGYEADGCWRVAPGSEEIAARVGASREMVSRVVKSMIASGAVRRFKRKLIVLDRQALKSACSQHSSAHLSSSSH